MSGKNITLDVTDAAYDWLVKKGYSTLLGARPMSRTIHEYIKVPLSKMILFGSNKSQKLFVNVVDDKLDIKFE